ncbi:hypothetical protein TNCT1_66970 [Streptomyces sp. 1-11]|nr:hypothetical protein TNCT1_66970 [Streptomyces sp. 1-11]
MCATFGSVPPSQLRNPVIRATPSGPESRKAPKGLIATAPVVAPGEAETPGFAAAAAAAEGVEAVGTETVDGVAVGTGGVGVEVAGVGTGPAARTAAMVIPAEIRVSRYRARRPCGAMPGSSLSRTTACSPGGSCY